MYRVNKRHSNRLILGEFILFIVPITIVLVFLIWFVFYRSTTDTVSFAKPGVQVASVAPKTTLFSTSLFSITLPATWVSDGYKNPFSNQEYYEYRNMQKNYDDQWLRVYVDVFPSDFPINDVLPVTVENNRMVPGTISSDCSTFNGAPTENTNSATDNQPWLANWQGISFTCDMVPSQTVGTASISEGYGITLKSKNGSSHKYFIVYIDDSAEPSFQNIVNAVQSFVTN